MDTPAPTGTSPASSRARVVDVLVPVALNQAYSYRVPRGMELQPGDVVCVPLGPREVIAVVWGCVGGGVWGCVWGGATHPPTPPRPNTREEEEKKKTLAPPPQREELR